MKNRNERSFNYQRYTASLLSLLFAGLLVLPSPVRATEDPPNCSLAHGGAGSVSQGGINFNLAQAHVGDTVAVFPSLGKVTNSCKAINVTGTVYIATGLLTNFLGDVTLSPGVLVACPDNALCQPGPYNLTITPALVGAEVNTPLGGASGLPKTVRAVENGAGTVQSIYDEQLSDFHTASIQIVTPCLQVTARYDYPVGMTCFEANISIPFSGAVTNCGDITLTNVTVLANRGGVMQLRNPTNNAVLAVPVTLAPGATAVFSNSLLPALNEACAGISTNTLTAIGTDTTAIGGSRATVTDNASMIWDICVLPGLVVTKQCSSTPVVPGGLLVYSGIVSNSGNVPLTNIMVVNNQPTNNTPVLGPVSLAPTATVAFTNSYMLPVDSCGPYADTLTTRANTTCGAPLTNTATAACVFADTQPPVIHCPTNLVLVCDVGRCTRSNVSFSVTATDNCSVTNLVSSPPSGSTFTIGVTTVTNTATDASGNASSCTFTVTVIDNQPPSITCPANVFAHTAPGATTMTNMALGTPFVSDNCTVVSVTNNAPFVMSIGTNIVVWTVTDSSGLTDACQQNVVVAPGINLNHVLAFTNTGYVTIPSSPALQNPTEMTVEAWFYPVSGALLSKSDGLNVFSDRSYEMAAAGSRVGVGFFLGSMVWACAWVNVAEANYFNNKWTHVAGTFNSSEGKIRLYVNGILTTETTNDCGGVIPLAGLTVRQSSQPVVLGFDTVVTGPLTGLMDEVRIWSIARTPEDILRDMSCRLTGSEPGLQACWNFDTGLANDFTGHDHTGSLVNSASIIPMVGEDVIHTGCEGGGCVASPAGLLTWWTGDGAPNDRYGTHHGSLSNGVAYATGVVGQCFSFDGVNDFVSVSNVPDVNFHDNTPMTIELWAYRTGAATGQNIIGKRIGCDGANIQYQMSFSSYNNEGLVFGANLPFVQTHVELPMNQWTHLAGTFDGTTLRFYINGNLMASQVAPLGPTNTGPLRIGQVGDCAGFEGLLDEIGIYNRALTPSEIQAIYAAGSAGKCKSPAFTGLTKQVDGSVQLDFRGETAKAISVLYSQDLTNWSLLSILPNIYGTNRFIDPASPGVPKKFYRLSQ